MENEWSGKRVIAHIDMDAFFAAIEVLDNPSLKGKPVVVGGNEKRGVVSSASYEARSYGIRSAMPIYKAKKLCPMAVFVRSRIRRYVEVSGIAMKCLEKFSPLVEQVSIDEAFVDLTGTEIIHGTALDAARAIKSRIYEETHLTCSVGVSFTKMLAKIASDLDKPNGLMIISPDKSDAFLARLPVEKVPGIGKKSLEELNKLGIRFVGDLLRFRPEKLEERFGKLGIWLCEVARGGSNDPVQPWAEPKSMSAEETFPEDTADERRISRTLRLESDRVARRLRREGYRGYTVTLKLKTSDFRSLTRSVTMPEATQLADTIYCEAKRLLRLHWNGSKLRLVGVGVSGLEPLDPPIQLGLFAPHDRRLERLEKLEKATDEIVRRFGEDALRRASEVEEET